MLTLFYPNNIRNNISGIGYFFLLTEVELSSPNKKKKEKKNISF